MERREALRCAAMDSRYLVSPRARQRAIDALQDDKAPEAEAAKVILIDGGTWQDIPGFSGYRYSLEAWRMAVDMLEAWFEEAGEAEALPWLVGRK